MDVSDWTPRQHMRTSDGLVHLVWRSTRDWSTYTSGEVFICGNAVLIYGRRGDGDAQPTEEPLTCLHCIVLESRAIVLNVTI